MTTERLEALIAGGETLAVEFKGEETGPFPDRELVEAVVCLANRTGDGPAWLLVGVEDDGRVSGARVRHEAGSTDPARIQALVSNRTRPSVSTRVDVVAMERKEVLVIEIPAVRQPVGTSDGRYLRRVVGGDGKPSCAPLHFHEMQSQQADRGMLDHSVLRLDGVGMEALDPLEFDRYRRTIREHRSRGDDALLELGDPELARALGAVEQDDGAVVVRVLGLLLFGREDALAAALPAHEVAFQALSDEQVQVNDFFRWPLLRVMEEMSARFRARNREQEIFVGMTRVGAPDYSERAFREALANALIHRDYTRLGAVHVQWRKHGLEISNPGGFPAGVRLDNLLVTAPRPRNPLLADAFKRAGLVERTARGIDTIFAEQVRNGRPAPSYAGSTEVGVSLVLPGGAPDLAFVRLVADEQRRGGPLSVDELLLLSELARERRVTAVEAAATIQKGRSEAEHFLRALGERGLVAGRGAARRQVFRLSDKAARRLDDRPDALGGRAEAIPHEALVLRYVTDRGSISRKETATLCAITAPQAYRLLQAMTSKRMLRRIGARGRSVRYENNR